MTSPPASPRFGAEYSLTGGASEAIIRAVLEFGGGEGMTREEMRDRAVDLMMVKRFH